MEKAVLNTIYRDIPTMNNSTLVRQQVNKFCNKFCNKFSPTYFVGNSISTFLFLFYDLEMMGKVVSNKLYRDIPTMNNITTVQESTSFSPFYLVGNPISTFLFLFYNLVW